MSMQASSKKKNISLEPNCKISFSEGARQETLTPLPSQFNQLEHFCSISPICACQMSFLYFPYFGQFCVSPICSYRPHILVLPVFRSVLSQCSFGCTSLHSVHGGDLNRRTCKKKKGYYFRALLFMFFGESPSGLRSRIFHLLCMNTCFSVHSPIWVFESVCRRRLVCRVNVV